MRAIEGTGSNDRLTGTDDADFITGGAGNDTVNGGAGKDTIEGNSGDDVQEGGDGSDTLSGGSDDDTLGSGAGNDTLTGGAGEDVFLFQTGHGNDVVTDFTVGQDLLIFEVTSDQGGDPSNAIGTAVDAEFNGQSGALIDTGGGNSIFLVGVSAQDLTQESLGV